MNLDANQLELINAAVDGELSDDERQELDALLSNNAQARAVHDELVELAATLDAVEPIPPPPYLKHVILNSLKPARIEPRPESVWDRIWSVPMVRQASAFAAGVVVAIVFISSEQNSQHAFDDVTGLVGTMNGSADQQPIDAGSRLTLSRSEIAGTVSSHRSGPLMIIDFDLVTGEPVEIVAAFLGGDIWFNGFAQLDNPDTRVSAEEGHVTLQMDGNGRYAVYLHNASGEAAIINLKFYASGELIHEEDISFSQAN